MSNHIVVGANFGDEGKGLVTDYLVKDLSDTIVIRFNGGGQAAHTVELSDGRKHVFHHIGSGSLRDAPTLLSEHFIVNPIVFNREFITIPENHIKVFAHRKALLTTPYDWLLNQKVEKKRDDKQHGTCGMGINETVTRTVGGYDDATAADKVRDRDVITTLADIYDTKSLKQKLRNIRNFYVPKRAKQLGINPEYIMDYNLSDYLEDCDLMSRLVIPVGNYNILKLFKNRVFEGAQGLLLDEYHYYYPHVTRSRTGINNATEILKSIGHIEANVHYVTRSYLTRHGPGPLPYEGEVEVREDVTNKHNSYQGILRFAPLNLDLLSQSITNDLINSNGLNLYPRLNITWGQHLDDFIDKNEYVYGDKIVDKLTSRLNIPQTWFYTPIME
jgi:adenylosuccinate synthase